MSRTYTIGEVQVPTSLDGPGGEVFEEYVAVRNAVESHTSGTDLLAMSLREMWSEYRSSSHRARRHFAAWQDGAIIGRGMVTTRPHDVGAGAFLMVDVLPASRRAGVGTALLGTVERSAGEAGVPVLKVAVSHTATAGGPRVPSLTGFGDLPADGDGVRFLRSHGYVLEQISRISRLDVPGLRERTLPLRESVAAAAAGYRVVTWTGHTPDRWVDDLAGLRTRMSTEAPSGGMVAAVDPWDAERVREHDERMSSSGRLVLTSAAEHLSTGRLVGFTELLVSEEGPVAVQEDTLVVRDHRGRRLGTVLKLAMADLLTDMAPGVQAVVTWNAEENRPMLDVNEAMGFRPIGYEGGWQKRVGAEGE